jgi:hypothetical protein
MGMTIEEQRSTGTGDWLAQLKKILQLGDEDQRDYGNNPKAEHRSTVTAVKLLLSNLRKGLKKTPDDNTSEGDKDFILFNAIDRLIKDKVEKSKRNKTQLEAVDKFETILKQEFEKQKNKKDEIDGKWLDKANETLKSLRAEGFRKELTGKNLEALEHVLDPSHNEPIEKRQECLRLMLETEEGKQSILTKTHVSIQALKAVQDVELGKTLLKSLNYSAFGGTDFQTFVNNQGDAKETLLSETLADLIQRTLPEGPDSKKEARLQSTACQSVLSIMDPNTVETVGKQMFKSQSKREKLRANPRLGGVLLSSIDPKALEDVDLSKTFRDAKNEVLGEALLLISQRAPKSGEETETHLNTLDPEFFKRLIEEIPPEVWNNKTATTGVLKGLGARICMELWNSGGYEQAGQLIEYGVDTSLATRVTDDVKGDREGFYSGFVQPLEHIIAKYLSSVDKLNTEDADDWSELQKQKVAGAKKIFETLGEDSVSLTKWSDVQNCEMMEEFVKAPGTIWGFEDVRGPYVQAAHETDKGSRPLRMWELWDAIGLNAKSYAELLEDPEGFAEKQVNSAAEVIASGSSTRVNYDHIDDLETFVKEFKKSAKALLLEFAAQLPKGTYTSVSKKAGFEDGKFIGALACKAGLWLAKEQGEPVYYCLDGINMDDVTNYKKMKNAAIDDFLKGKNKKRHDEVITMVEVREILKHWDELKDEDGNSVVKFVLKGKILTGEQLEKKIAEWQKAMAKVDQKNPTPAPDFNGFSAELNKVDDKLLEKLSEKAKINKKEANRDGLAILKKHGYLVKLANTRPHIALKYIMAKCEVLSEYELISEDLPEAAESLIDALDDGNTKEIKKAAKKLKKEIEKCHADYHAPLKKALLGDTTSDD